MTTKKRNRLTAPDQLHTMPHSYDLRAGYFSLDLNMEWFYEAMTDCRMTFEFDMTHNDYHDGQEQTQTTIDLFEKHIEDAFHNWTVYKVIGHKMSDYHYEIYETVWEFLFDVAEEYSRKNPKVKIIHEDDDE